MKKVLLFFVVAIIFAVLTTLYERRFEIKIEDAAVRFGYHLLLMANGSAIVWIATLKEKKQEESHPI